MRMQIKVWLAALALCLCAHVTWAQLYSGSVTGIITDPSNAAVPRAKVSLEDPEKGTGFNAETDDSGRFLFRSLPPATYKVTVTAEGFQSQTRGGITVDINQNLTVSFSLPLRTSAETITVVGEAPLLATEDASLGQVINRQFMDSLPNVGRNVMNLSYLTPGVTPASQGKTQSGQGANDFVGDGGRAWTTDILIDGISATNYEQNGGLLVTTALPSPDAIQEFKVQTGNFSAEFGFTGSTVVNVVLVSGTNTFHGSAYEYFRNSQLNANAFFNNKAGVARPAYGRNNFGATVGGPIKRGKTFFFFDYDAFRERKTKIVNFGVPSAAERTGNFGELCGYKGGTFDSAGKCSAAAGQIWDPYSGTYSASAGGSVKSAYIPFNNMATYMSPGNPNLAGTPYQLAPKPGNLIDPVAQKMMSYMPLPNLGVGTSSYQYFNNWFKSGTTPNQTDQWDAKVDHHFSDATVLNGKFSWQLPNHRNLNAFGNAADTIAIGLDNNHLFLYSMNLTHTFSPSLLFTASYGFNRWWESAPGVIGDYPGLDPVKELGLPAYMKASGESVFPQVAAGDSYLKGSSGISAGNWGSTHISRGQDTHQGLATMSWIKGSHELKVGGEIRMHRINWYMPGNPGGSFSYNYSGTSQTPSSSTGGDAMATLLTGVTNSGSYEVPSAFSTQNFEWGGFVQDNWKIRRNLTLNLGMRYDVNVPRTERYNKMNWLDLTAVSPLKVPGMGTLMGGEVFATAGDRHAYNTYHRNFQPRVGFSWQALNKTVIRGGYGIFAANSRGAATGGAFGGSGFARSTTAVTTMNSDGATPWGRLSDPFPGTGPLTPRGNSLGLLNDVGFAATGPIRSQSVTPYEQTWSFGIQRELPAHFLLDASYVGKRGTHLYFGGDSNLNILGPQIEQYSSTQIAGLLSYVPNPFYGIITDRNSVLSAATVQAYRLQLPYPQFTTVGGDSPPVANSIYNALQVRFEKRFSAGLQLLASYTFSKALDDASVSANSWNTGSSSLQDPNNRALEYSVSLYDETHVFRFNYVYDLPFGRGKKIGNNWNPVVNGILGGWQFNGIWEFGSGRPLRPGLSGGQSLPTYGGQRPNLVARPEKNTGADWMTQYFANPSAFAVPARYAIGNAPRTLPWVRTPGLRNGNLSVAKDFSLSKIREGMRLRCIVQAVNAMNKPLFAGPNMTYNSSAFGTVTSQQNGPREIEMALKFNF